MLLCSRTECDGTTIRGLPDSVNFGQRLALSENVLVIGAAHHAYIYRIGVGVPELEVPNAMYTNSMISTRSFTMTLLSTESMVLLPTTMQPLPNQDRLAFGGSNIGESPLCLVVSRCALTATESRE